MADELILEDGLQVAIAGYCKAGDSLAAAGDHDAAVKEYNQAWKLVPDPKNDWEASTWILAAIADSCFHLGKLKSARSALDYAMTCPGAIGNPFLHLRRGQILYEQNEPDAAADELMRAFMAEGYEVFENEDEKYLNFLASRADLGTAN